MAQLGDRTETHENDKGTKMKQTVSKWLQDGCQGIFSWIRFIRRAILEESTWEWRTEGRTGARPAGWRGGCSFYCPAECESYSEIHLRTLASRSHLKSRLCIIWTPECWIRSLVSYVNQNQCLKEPLCVYTLQVSPRINLYCLRIKSTLLTKKIMSIYNQTEHFLLILVFPTWEVWVLTTLNF